MTNIRALHQFTDGTIHRNGVTDRCDGADQERAISFGVIHAAQPRLINVPLRLVEALTVGLPDVENYTLNRPAVEIAHETGNKAGHAWRAIRHVGTIGKLGRAVNVEWPGDGRWSGAGCETMVDCVHKHAHPEHVREQDEFLTLITGHLTGPGQPVDRGGPFCLGRFDVADKSMNMLDQ